ncbi:type II toxin-antitoxin system Phd/YefM family antitoxin [Niveispirillum sp. KHB5.9]|uniref:type II toxin-antitoxin system Phd/YefM family antitoxin n=1 Tax=Niveispirillum sp. KHB5.9 TaxID=3400269 RepID=UPI003A89C761
MDSVNLADVASNLTRLIERAEAGEEIVIYRAGRPVARLMPPVEGISTTKPQRVFGQLAGQGYWVGDDFDDPLPEEIAKAFRGEGT